MTQQQVPPAGKCHTQPAGPPCSCRRPRPRRHPAPPTIPRQQRLRKHPKDVRLRLAVLPGLGPGPRQPLPAGFATSRRRLSRPPGRRPRPLGGHHPTAQGRPGRRPQNPWPRRTHRPRGSPKNHEGHRPHPRPHPKTGQTPSPPRPWPPSGPPPTPGAHLGDGKKQESAERASWREQGGPSPPVPFSGTACSDAQTLICSPGQT